MDYKFYLNWCKWCGLNPVAPQSMAIFKELDIQEEIVIRG